MGQSERFLRTRNDWLNSKALQCDYFLYAHKSYQQYFHEIQSSQTMLGPQD